MQMRTALIIAGASLGGAVLSPLASVPALALDRPQRVEDARQGGLWLSRTPTRRAPGELTAPRKAAGPTGIIAGEVRAAGTGAPLAGGWVRALDAAGEYAADVLVDVSGAFAFGLPTGSYYMMTANSLGYIDELYLQERSI